MSMALKALKGQICNLHWHHQIGYPATGRALASPATLSSENRTADPDRPLTRCDSSEHDGRDLREWA